MKSSLWWLLRLTPLASLTYISLTKALISPLQTQHVASREIWYFGEKRRHTRLDSVSWSQVAPPLLQSPGWLSDSVTVSFINSVAQCDSLCLWAPSCLWASGLHEVCRRQLWALQQCAAVMALLTITERGGGWYITGGRREVCSSPYLHHHLSPLSSSNSTSAC